MTDSPLPQDVMEAELDLAFAESFDDQEEQGGFVEEKKKKKKSKRSGRGRTKVVQDERLPHPQAMFRSKFHTAYSNFAHICAQSGVNGIMMTIEKGRRGQLYLTPMLRPVFRRKPEVFGMVSQLSEECLEGPLLVNPLDNSSYSTRIPYTPIDIRGNTRAADGVSLLKRKIDTYMNLHMDDLPIAAEEDDDEDGAAVILESIRKRLMAKKDAKDEEIEKKGSDLEKAKSICSAFADANIVSTGPKSAPKPSFIL